MINFNVDQRRGRVFNSTTGFIMFTANGYFLLVIGFMYHTVKRPYT